jgi:hypothetical protein
MSRRKRNRSPVYDSQDSGSEQDDNSGSEQENNSGCEQEDNSSEQEDNRSVQEAIQQINTDVDNFFTQILMNEFSNQIYNYDPPTPIFQSDTNYFHNEYSQLRIMLISSRYKVDEYNQALDYFNTLANNYTLSLEDETQNINPTIQILNIILDLYFEGALESMPSRLQIIDRVISYQCNCLRSYDISEPQLRQIVNHSIFSFGIYPTCYEIILLVEYQTIQQNLPSIEQFNTFMSNNINFFTDPENFHNNDKIHIPTLNLDSYSRTKATSDINTSCGICQDDFKEGDTLITLEPCGHQFHSLSEECLDTASVIDWLTNHNYCPLCKSRVTKDQNNEAI